TGRVRLWRIIAGLVGGRLYFVAQNQPVWYLTHPQHLLAVWEGRQGLLRCCVRRDRRPPVREQAASPRFLGHAGAAHRAVRTDRGGAGLGAGVVAYSPVVRQSEPSAPMGGRAG